MPYSDSCDYTPPGSPTTTPTNTLPKPPDLYGDDWEDREDAVIYALMGTRAVADTLSIDIDSIVPFNDAPGFAGHHIVLGVDIQGEPDLEP